ncbi:TetR/AcrR family transcriptional regulator [Rhodoplanes sp. TEM]|uniref:TetR/AcrR family transcriptional regulator n=2 Tax=Rhodoplanes TaxID=29407 RepID=A0ABT5JIN8_RHOTP|nr:TetR/AcrR family transcriptional regulator [Rhodoplanes tepidamans]MDC7789568.1 TetR/AcrR family transcriptional regulator [Rhodoplanes tepidamans]MDC7986541.1 TetR/AcrR family transcriptional regulator [Rhodoplanes sp. TEM]MDQ0357959.1 AcrR family transcriptional regulator [Rhodoplanes tepidamans]
MVERDTREHARREPASDDATAAPRGRPGRREKNKEDKLRRIKDVARELFVSKGFDDTTIRQIATRADVGLGTVFIYAATKRDLLFLIANEGLDEVASTAAASVDPEAALIDNLLGVFGPHYAFFARQPELSRLVLREMAFYDSGAQAGSFQKTREALIELLGTIVRHAAERREIATDEAPQFVGWTIFCIYQVELRRWLSDGTIDLESGLDRLRRALMLLIRGLGSGSGTTR